MKFVNTAQLLSLLVLFACNIAFLNGASIRGSVEEIHDDQSGSDTEALGVVRRLMEVSYPDGPLPPNVCYPDHIPCRRVFCEERCCSNSIYTDESGVDRCGKEPRRLQPQHLTLAPGTNSTIHFKPARFNLTITTMCFEDGTVCSNPRGCNRCCNKPPMASSGIGWSQLSGICGETGRDSFCLKDSIVCNDEETCKTCCSKKSTQWITKPGMPLTCGDEPCLKNGTECFGEDCNKCCIKPFSQTGWPEQKGICNEFVAVE